MNIFARHTETERSLFETKTRAHIARAWSACHIIKPSASAGGRAGLMDRAITYCATKHPNDGGTAEEHEDGRGCDCGGTNSAGKAHEAEGRRSCGQRPPVLYAVATLGRGRTGRHCTSRAAKRTSNLNAGRRCCFAAAASAAAAAADATTTTSNSLSSAPLRTDGVYDAGGGRNHNGSGGRSCNPGTTTEYWL